MKIKKAFVSAFPYTIPIFAGFWFLGITYGVYMNVTQLNRFYWVSGATIGGLLGSLIKFDTKGLEFVMTAMFVVIFMEQWLKEKHHLSEYIGLAASVVCLLIFGADRFLIPTMICIVIGLTAIRKTMEAKEEMA